MANWSIRLTTRGNPDFQQYAPITDPETLTADTLPELRDKIKEWKSYWTVGGGNWMMPLVKKGDLPVGYMSYNGRLWNQEFMDTDDDDQKKKYGQYFPKQLQITGDDPEPMVLVTSKLLDEYRIKKLCDNCTEPLDEYEHSHHRCRADINSCIEGINCPDYVESCDCVQCASEEAYEIEEWHRETD